MTDRQRRLIPLVLWVVISFAGMLLLFRGTRTVTDWQIALGLGLFALAVVVRYAAERALGASRPD